MKTKNFIENKSAIAYIIGVALGDGNLSNPNGRAVRLRITCDLKYPFLVEKIKRSIQVILPNNRVSIVKKKGNCLDISCYSNRWEEILGWKAIGGPKFKQNVRIPEWIKSNRGYTVNCLRGLIETDGSIYEDRGYKMVIFKTVIEDLARDVYEASVFLGFAPRIYKIEQKTKYDFNQQIAYHVRLSRDVAQFLEIVRPEKV